MKTDPVGAEQRRPGAAALLLALVAGLVGGFAGGLLVSRAPSVSTAGAPNAEERQTREALAALTRQLEELRSDLAQRGLPTAAPQPLGPSGNAALDDQVSTPERLAEMVAERLRATGVGAGAPVTPSGERAPLVDTFVDVPARGPDQQAALTQAASILNSDEEGVERHFLLWTERQVLDRFGFPDYVGAHEGTSRWEYSLSDELQIGFAFLDGLVVNCW